MRKTDGFSLIELIIATSLASFVLVGVATIAAQMARSQVEGIRNGTVTGWSLVSYLSMAKEIEDSNVLAYPTVAVGEADSLVVCKNWSRGMGAGGGKLDNAAPVSIILYCVDTTAPVAPQTGFLLRRYAHVGPTVTCPSPANPPACTASTGAPWGAWDETGVIGFRLEKDPVLTNMFKRDDSIGGVRLRYVIGRQTPTQNEPNPKSTAFNFGIAMQKQYSSALD